ncbi:MAG: hypothetical protein HY897_25230 [Deltaproteobacteria bacterium]|nr:hypothetical protein [Deltaproteobacteria bacterium]
MLKAQELKEASEEVKHLDAARAGEWTVREAARRLGHVVNAVAPPAKKHEILSAGEHLPVSWDFPDKPGVGSDLLSVCRGTPGEYLASLHSDVGNRVPRTVAGNPLKQHDYFRARRQCGRGTQVVPKANYPKTKLTFGKLTA